MISLFRYFGQLFDFSWHTSGDKSHASIHLRLCTGTHRASARSLDSRLYADCGTAHQSPRSSSGHKSAVCAMPSRQQHQSLFRHTVRAPVECVFFISPKMRNKSCLTNWLWKCENKFNRHEHTKFVHCKKKKSENKKSNKPRRTKSMHSGSCLFARARKRKSRKQNVPITSSSPSLLLK